MEGVMMRSPHSFVVVCRRPDLKIVIRAAPWTSVWERLRFLRWPLLRGAVVFWEALQNGLQALSFSAEQQTLIDEERTSVPDMESSPGKDVGEGKAGEGTRESKRPCQQPAMSKAAITGTILFSLALGFLIFGALPHLLTWLSGQAMGINLNEGKSLAFHAMDGLIKLLLFLLYLWGISRLREIRRVFMYHGAEHKSIFTYEAGEELIPANARKHSTYHPRCGTSFLILVIIVSILVFTGVFSGPWMPVFSDNRVLNQAIYVLIKLPLLLPIAGISYEFLRLSGRFSEHPLLKPLIWPGLALQRITTQEPTDDMLEIALLSLRQVLRRETRGRGTDAPEKQSETRVYASFDEVDLPVNHRPDGIGTAPDSTASP